LFQASLGSSSPVGSLSSEDHDFDPTAEMLVHEFDDERTLEEEESIEGGTNFNSELADLEKEGNMPLEELLALYRYEASASIDSSSGDLTDELPDMTLDKEEIAKDLLSGDYEEETQSSADDLTPSVTSHEATDFFPRTLRSNAVSDGDKESECDEDGLDDTRKLVLSFIITFLFFPGVLSENKVKGFLSDAWSRTANERTGNDKAAMSVRDNEQVNHGSKDQFSIHCNGMRNAKKSPPWSEDECRNFEHGLQMHDKNFHLIQKHKVTTRTVAECVAFYYRWKKSERFDFFVQQNRFGKKKYNTYPGVTDLMDRLVDEAEGLAMDSSSSVCSGAGGGGRMETTEQQLSLLNSITASDLTALSNTVATVCSPAEVSCLDSYSFPPLDSLHRSSLSHDESLGFPTNGGDPDCLNMLDAGFYHSDLGQLGGVCVTKECERPSKRLKMALPDSFISDVSVGNLGVDYEARRTTHHHRITGAKMAVSVTDFASLAGSGEPIGFLGAHTRHHTQHTAALQSE
uniref:Mesoderm induction early response 1, family member 3 b n=1 Tax=Oryzias latipes TaxID=8090 RepID=A0A3P9J4T1_ORYLA